MSKSAQTKPAPAKARPTPKRRRKSRKLPPYNVVLIDDNQHSYPYVVEMLRGLFGYDGQRAYTMAREVDSKGRVIVFTTHRELAELKRNQILGWGADWRIETCQGSMTAVIEPAR